ncbi:MAG TPA: sigma-70 family RNA polymerase sigma factor [Longimicrobiales bacterium]|nr:sigma-70 family RNA polymerase sigma factor [Longimicrobiales bacterium]
MPAATHDDAALLRSVAAGSLEALGTLYARHADAVYGVALRLTGSPAEAEDVLQDMFVGLPRALGAYTERGRFEAWLKRVAVRVALMHLRTRRRWREVPLDALPPRATAAGAPHPADRIDLERLVARLPDSLRTVFVLKEVEGYGHAEIGELLGITPGNSAARLSRAWAILRKEAGR